MHRRRGGGCDIDRRRALRRQMQMVFQDPYSSLNPQMRIGQAIAEPIRLHGIVPGEKVQAEVDRLLERVGLPASAAARNPSELSGGQRQRVGIARALSVRPELLIADEAVSGLDVSVRAQVLNLLSDLRQELGVTLMFISHDLGVIEYLPS
jgi:ABC-type glutathione transport system ATPase component